MYRPVILKPELRATRSCGYRGTASNLKFIFGMNPEWTPHDTPTSSPKFHRSPILVDPPQTGPRCLKFCTRLPLESRAISPFILSLVSLYSNMHSCTRHTRGREFPVFLTSFLPHIAISNNYPARHWFILLNLLDFCILLPGIRNERRRGCLSLLLCILHPRSCHFAGEFVSRILRWLSVFISFFIFMFSSLFFSCLAFFCEFSFTRNFSVILLTFFSNLNDYRATTRKEKLSFLVDTIFIFSVNFSAILRFCSLLYISSWLSKILYFSLLLLTKFQSESIQNSTHFHFIHSPLFVCFPIIGVIVS